MNKWALPIVLSLSMPAAPAVAQFVGPFVEGKPSTVAEARRAGSGSYVVVTGNISLINARDLSHSAITVFAGRYLWVKSLDTVCNRKALVTLRATSKASRVLATLGFALEAKGEKLSLVNATCAKRVDHGSLPAYLS